MSSSRRSLVCSASICCCVNFTLASVICEVWIIGSIHKSSLSQSPLMKIDYRARAHTREHSSDQSKSERDAINEDQKFTDDVHRLLCAVLWCVQGRRARRWLMRRVSSSMNRKKTATDGLWSHFILTDGAPGWPSIIFDASNFIKKANTHRHHQRFYTLNDLQIFYNFRHLKFQTVLSKN